MRKVLLTGATGYIGKRLLPILVQNGYYVICGVRDKNKFHTMESLRGCMEVIELDLTNKESLNSIPSDIDFAYYLVHSMSTSRNYDVLEKQSAINFREAIKKNQCYTSYLPKWDCQFFYLIKTPSFQTKCGNRIGKGYLCVNDCSCWNYYRFWKCLV